jgi:hypothetical protein
MAVRHLPLMVLLGATIAAGAAWADAGLAPQNVGADARPAKDCTRHNGRYGYYANPWCTPAEQERWDRWEARRARLGR